MDTESKSQSNISMSNKTTNESSKSGVVSQRLPDFLIVGEMRCGSTTLWEMLSRHPKIFFPEEKELHFFDDRDGKWQRGVEWYAERYSDSATDSLCGEATPDYLFHQGACERIAETVPGAKLLVILRDPVERAWSHYWHNVRRGRELLSFEEALKAEPERLTSEDPQICSHFSYVTRGHYIKQLQRFEAIFGRDALCVVFLEDVKISRRQVIEEVCRHVGVDVTPRMLEEGAPQRNKAEYPRWPRISAFTQSVMKRVKGKSIIEVPARRIAAMTRSLRTYSGASSMEADVRARLAKSYVQSNLDLQEWLGRPVPWSDKVAN